MDYDVIAWTHRKRWDPLKHACISTTRGLVSLCGALDQTLWSRPAVGITTGSKWLHDVTCPRCAKAVRPPEVT